MNSKGPDKRVPCWCPFFFLGLYMGKWEVFVLLVLATFPLPRICAKLLAFVFMNDKGQCNCVPCWSPLFLLDPYV
uniref:Uncharacterized protein n=1 Tax=Rhizophora mucronata TaxID=61149 RepID=A0A2P2R348_RHIMU